MSYIKKHRCLKERQKNAKNYFKTVINNITIPKININLFLDYFIFQFSILVNSFFTEGNKYIINTLIAKQTRVETSP